MTKILKNKIIEATSRCDDNFPVKRSRFLHLFASSLPVFFLWFHYHHVIAYWWMGDDPVILWDTIEKGIFSHFYKPDVWRSFSAANLTPWIQLSFGLDWHLFGLDPSGFYRHQILSFTIVLFAAYGVLTLNLSPALSSFVLILFTFSVPSASIVQTLMVRHYLEGLGLALAGYYCYVVADRSNRHRWSFAGAFFYLLAVTAKEIYIPLVVILPAISINSGRNRFKMLIPFIFVAGVYVLWRAYMLHFGSILSGYQHIAQPGLHDLLMFPQAAAEIMGWNHFWQKAVVLVGCLSVLITTDMRLFQTYAKLGLWFIIIFAPIFPVLGILDVRYLFLPAFMLFVFIGHNIMKLWIKKTYQGMFRAFAICLIVALFISTFQTADSAHYNFYKELEDRYRKEGQFVLYGSDDQSSLINPVGPPWYYLGLKWLRQNVLRESLGPGVCYGPYFCDALDHQKGYRYINHNLSQVEWPDIKENLKYLDNTADLFFNISYVSGILHWCFGPYTDGVYRLITYDKLHKIFGYAIQLPKQNTISFQLQAPLGFILQYESPEGWKTSSPAMILDPISMDASGAAHVQWKRN